MFFRGHYFFYWLSWKGTWISRTNHPFVSLTLAYALAQLGMGQNLCCVLQNYVMLLHNE